MSLIRILHTAQVVLTHTFYVDETPTDASGTVTVSVKRLDGTVVAGGNAAHPGSPGIYTYTVPAQSAVDILTVDWTGTIAGATITARDIVEVVGGFLFGLAEARAMPPALDANRFPTSMLAAKRIGVEQECEAICRQAFVPRFAREVLDGTGHAKITLRNINVRTIRKVTVDGVALSGQELASLYVDRGGVITRGRYGSGWWRIGVANVVVEYEHGMDYPPEDIREAAMLRLRSRLTMGDTGVPARALSFTVADGGVYRLSVPGERRTGVPDVDAAYERWSIDYAGLS